MTQESPQRPAQCAHISLSRARKALSEVTVNDAAQKFATLYEHGTLKVELYEPKKADYQTPHRQDEAYIIIDGTGIFEMADERVPFAPGDFLFVAAGVPHRFTQFGESMTTWVIFYGPDGGEPT
ncbi:cupin domain-containing protein [Candidatus Puniceispirillum sp.]|uniref:cupin domain-containing protein n=1 Tax=Candidatus Puniceispirillum sp. TaxID=2026719 RepID=UPI003F696CB3